MPNYPRRNKKSGPQNRERGRAHVKARSAKDLLSSAADLMESVAAQTRAQRTWRTRLDACLPAELARRVTGVVANERGELVVFTESAAWSARLRFALAECEAELRRADPALSQIEVRVLPDGRDALS